MTPLDRAKADLLRLQRELSRAQLQVVSLQGQIEKIEAYIELAPLYESDDPVGEGKARGGGISAIAVRKCVEAIQKRGKRIHTRELVKILAEQGIEIGGANPIANLSGFLSRAEELHNNRAEGWGMAEWAEAERQDIEQQLTAAQNSGRATPPTPSETWVPPSSTPNASALGVSLWDDDPPKAPASELDDEIPF